MTLNFTLHTLLSDIHKRMIDLELIDQVGRVDVVVIGGDLAEKGVSFEQIKENINRLKKIGPVYFVWGNNDYELDYHLLDATLLDLGVKILDNTAVLFESKTGDKISLLGVDYIGFERARLDLALQDSEEGTFKILVSHSPAIAPQLKEGVRPSQAKKISFPSSVIPTALLSHLQSSPVVSVNTS